MCEFGREASPKDGVTGTSSNIADEHEFHARNNENAGIHILGAFGRENLCIQLYGGGAGTRTRVQRRAEPSFYEA